MSNKGPNRYIPGLDGLRAFAVIAVLAYHFHFSWAKGGFLGVDLFFVLSGYLITSILMPAEGEPLKLNLRKFWIGRIRRLLPASFAMIMLTFLWVILFHPDLVRTVRGDAASSIFYVSNWWFIFHEVSYFDSFGLASPLKNLWSLAVEEQFYILWPILLALLLKFVGKRNHFAIVIFIGAIGSAILMAFLYQPGIDPSRVYYGTDTRSFELLIGCWLAIVWPMNRLSEKKLTLSHTRALNSISIIASVLLLTCVVMVNEFQPFLYQGGMLLISVVAAILVASVCHPASLIGKWLSWKPLRWVGTRSYSIYLWHYPIIILSTPLNEMGNPVLWRVLLQILVTFCMAELSYRFIETPIRKQGFTAFFQQYYPRKQVKWRHLSMAKKIFGIVVPMALLLFAAGMTGVVKGEEHRDVSDAPTEIKIIHEEHVAGANGNIHDKTDKTLDSNPYEEVVQNKEDEEGAMEEVVEQSDVNGETTETEQKSFTGILAIGDSVMIDLAPSLQKAYPHITIDAKVGRQVAEAAKLAPNYTAYNQHDKAVILVLGTNGYFTNSQIDSLLESFSNAQVILVNTRVPRAWESNVNAAFLKKSQENERIALVNWHDAAINHPEYFAPDGVHLMPKGVETLTNLITESIEKGADGL